MSSTQSGSKRATPAMNVTPLVDVVLVLLIIFMVVVPKLQKGAQVDLPAVLNIDEEQRGRTDPVTLSVQSDGSLYYERDRLPEAEFESRLRAFHESEPLRRIVLRGDRNVQYGRMRVLYGICQRIGFPGVALQVNAHGQSASN
ncbi:MAG: biopolymer transporter ExbD [Sandaracinaceae bacterium]|nr:biopolymer transporter ExbD [Sandaracinaceae bacterium]